MPADARTRPVLSLLLSRPVWVGATLVFVAIVLGCMSAGTREEVITREVVLPEPPEGIERVQALLPGDGLLEQEGDATVPAHAVLDVYYPVPYVSPPNVVVRGGFDECLLVAQKADHFRIKNPEGSSRHVSWKARGVKVLLAKAGPPPGALPPEPIPVTVKDKSN